MPVDPVCGMEVGIAKAIRLEKKGETLYFCSQNCRDKFVSGGGASPGGEDRHRKVNDTRTGQACHGGGGASEHAHMVKDFKRRFFVSLIATLPVLILSPLIQSFLNYSLDFPGARR